MEYLINTFNLSEINLTNNDHMVSYFIENIIAQRVKNMLLGPNLVNLKYPKGTIKESNEEDRKIINTLSRLIIYNLGLRTEQNFLIQSNSNTSARSLIKKILYELDSLLIEKSLNVDRLSDALEYYDIFSFFTCMKEENDEEISLCDINLILSMVENKVVFSAVELINLADDLLLNRGEYMNNIHIFYIMTYGITNDELHTYLYSEKTKKYFKILENKDKDDFIVRYIFINQFSLLRNNSQVEEISYMINNVEKIRSEFEYYKKLNKIFLKIVNENNLDLRYIYESISSIILLYEIDIFSKLEGKVISSKISKFLNKAEISIISKISDFLKIESETFLQEILGKDNKLTRDNYSKSKENIIKRTYNKMIDYLKTKININKVGKNRFTFVITTTNLTYKRINNIKKENEKIYIESNIVNSIISNYIRELKNYIFFQIGMNITSPSKEQNWQNTQNNQTYVMKLLNQYYFKDILNFYSNCLLPIIDNVNNYKNINFGTYRNKVININDNIVIIHHTFGTFYYNITNLITELGSMVKKINYKEAERFYKNFLITLTYNSIVLTISKDITVLDDVIAEYKLYYFYYYYSNLFNFIINPKDIRDSISRLKKQILPKDDISLFKSVIANKTRLTSSDYIYENGFIYAKQTFARILGINKNISCLIFKYNFKMFNYLVTKKMSEKNFSRFSFAVNAVMAFIKLTKIYSEKKVFKQLRDLIMDIISAHYSNISSVDYIKEFIFDFKNEILSKNLPKLHSHLRHLKYIWKNYITDLMYLEKNKSNFTYPAITERIIQDRLNNFKILLFLFSKNYTFNNYEHLKKTSILHLQFTKTIATEVLEMMKRYSYEMRDFLEEYHFETNKTENVNFEILFKKRETMKLVVENIKKYNTTEERNYNLWKLNIDFKKNSLPSSRYYKDEDKLEEEKNEYINLVEIIEENNNKWYKENELIISEEIENNYEEINDNIDDIDVLKNDNILNYFDNEDKNIDYRNTIVSDKQLNDSIIYTDKTLITNDNNLFNKDSKSERDLKFNNENNLNNLKQNEIKESNINKERNTIIEHFSNENNNKDDKTYIIEQDNKVFTIHDMNRLTNSSEIVKTQTNENVTETPYFKQIINNSENQITDFKSKLEPEYEIIPQSNYETTDNKDIKNQKLYSIKSLSYLEELMMTLNRELNALELIQGITESTAKLVFPDLDFSKIPKQSNKIFFRDIEKDIEKAKTIL